MEIFRRCPPNITSLRKTKQGKNCQIYNFFFFKCPIVLSDSSTMIFKKRKKCSRNKTLLYKVLFKVQICPLNTTLLQKTKKRCMFKNVFFIASNQHTTMITTEKNWRTRENVPLISNFYKKINEESFEV